jgi:beta-lactamase class A
LFSLRGVRADTMADKADLLTERIRRIVASAPCRMGVSVSLAGRGSVFELDSDRSFPLASVYKIPLMATLFHRVDRGEIDLDERLVLRDEDKSLGSSDLQFLRPGLNLTLHDLCYEMIVHSDNTATDMIHYRLGIDAPVEYMRELGLDSFDIYCPNREYFLMFLGWADRFKDMRLKEIAMVWKSMTRKQRVDALMEIREQTRSRSPKEAQERAVELWGYADEKEMAEDRFASSVIDNHGSPKDLTKLLELIVTNKIASPKITEQMIGYMVLCDSRDRLPARIPPGVKVGNKTGTVPGTENDCAIIFASKKNILCCSCLADNVKYSDKRAVAKKMADIGLVVYEAFKR